MREEYDFGNAGKDSYAQKEKKQVIINLNSDVVEYFKQQAEIIGSNVLIVIISYMLCSFVSESFIGLVVRVVISGLTVLLVELIFMRKTEEFAKIKLK